MTEQISERIAYTRGKLEGMTGTVGASIKGIAECFETLSQTLQIIDGHLNGLGEQLNTQQLNIDALSRSLTEVINYLNSGTLMTKQEDPVAADVAEEGVDIWVTPEEEEPGAEEAIVEVENIAIDVPEVV